jgi:hypothetical protein
MIGARNRMLRTLSAAAALVAIAPMGSRLLAQGTVTVTLGATTLITAPGGTEIEAGATATVSAKATVVSCSHDPCTVLLKTSGPATGPGSAALQYCITSCTLATSWSDVPTTGNGALLGSVNGTASVDVPFQLRYRLTWTGSTPGSYTVPIAVTLKN